MGINVATLALAKSYTDETLRKADLGNIPETDPTVPAWAKKEAPPKLSELENDAGFAAEKPWRLLDMIDFSLPENYNINIEWKDLGGVTDIFMQIKGCQNATATASGSALYINGKGIAHSFAPNKGKDTIQYWWASAHYNGLVWIPVRSTGAISKDFVTPGSPQVPYNLVNDVGAAETITLYNAGQYCNIAGTWEIWVR